MFGAGAAPITLAVANNMFDNMCVFMHCTSTQVNFQPGNLVSVPLEVPEGGTPKWLDLELLQFHFHTPSEHAVNGKRYAMEAHLVHRNRSTGGWGPVQQCIMETSGFLSMKHYQPDGRCHHDQPGTRLLA